VVVRYHADRDADRGCEHSVATVALALLTPFARVVAFVVSQPSNAAVLRRADPNTRAFHDSRSYPEATFNETRAFLP
jgi:hypothetical protein